MNRFFRQMLDEELPKFNPSLVEGLAFHQMRYSKEWIDNTLHSASETYQCGLRFMHSEIASPAEEYRFGCRKSGNKYVYETSRNDVMLIKYYFEFNGEPLPPRYRYLVFSNKGGLVTLSGAQWVISPVLTDKVISPNPFSVFIRLFRDKLKFFRLHYGVKINGERSSAQVIHSEIYHSKLKIDSASKTTHALSTVVHYLLGKYGVNGMFERFLGTIPVIGKEEVNEINYPPDEWTIVSSSNTPPKKVKYTDFEPHGIRIALPKEVLDPDAQDFNSSLALNMVGGLMYVLDYFYNHVNLEMLDDTVTWKVLLGHICLNGDYTIDKLYSTMKEHYQFLDSYMDVIIQEKLHELGYVVNDFYELLGLVLEYFNEWTLNSGKYNKSIHSRYYDVLYYILYDLTSSIFTMYNELTKEANRKELTAKNALDALSSRFNPATALNITKYDKLNLAISGVESSGDNLIPRITSIVALQETGNGVLRSKQSSLPETVKTISGAHTVLGSMLFLTKKYPSGLVRINPFANVDPKTGKIDPDDEMKRNIDILDAALEGKLDNVNYVNLEE